MTSTPNTPTLADLIATRTQALTDLLARAGVIDTTAFTDLVAAAMTDAHAAAGEGFATTWVVESRSIHWDANHWGTGLGYGHPSQAEAEESVRGDIKVAEDQCTEDLRYRITRRELRLTPVVAFDKSGRKRPAN